MSGIKNYGATCWFNALMQCLMKSRKWDEDTADPFTKEFLGFMNQGSEDELDNSNELDPVPFLREFVKKFPDWQGLPNDAQEALILLLDIFEKTINLTDFTGEVTQTITFPKGTSVTKYPCTIFLNNEQLVLSDYKDNTGTVHNVAIQETFLTKIPKILVLSDIKNKVEEEMFGKKLFALIPWYGGHYIAFVNVKDSGWHLFDDESVSNATPNLNHKYYLAFYK